MFFRFTYPRTAWHQLYFGNHIVVSVRILRTGSSSPWFEAELVGTVFCGTLRASGSTRVRSYAMGMNEG